jgi:hypothetical protein
MLPLALFLNRLDNYLRDRPVDVDVNEKVLRVLGVSVDLCFQLLDDFLGPLNDVLFARRLILFAFFIPI